MVNLVGPNPLMRLDLFWIVHWLPSNCANSLACHPDLSFEHLVSRRTAGIEGVHLGNSQRTSQPPFSTHILCQFDWLIAMTQWRTPKLSLGDITLSAFLTSAMKISFKPRESYNIFLQWQLLGRPAGSVTMLQRYLDLWSINSDLNWLNVNLVLDSTSSYVQPLGKISLSK